MLRAVLVSSLMLVALPSVAAAQLVVTTTPASSPTHGGIEAVLVARLHVENPTDAPCELSVTTLVIIDASGVTQRVSPIRLLRDGHIHRVITVAPGASLDVDIEVPRNATVQVAYHVEYHQVLELLVGGRPQRLERPGAFQFRAPRDVWY